MDNPNPIREFLENTEGHPPGVDLVHEWADLVDQLLNPWIPIETAPSDETILVYHPEAGVCESWYETEQEKWFILDGRNLKEYTYYYSDIIETLPCLTYLLSPPTHWTPLPPPPAKGGG